MKNNNPDTFNFKQRQDLFKREKTFKVDREIPQFLCLSSEEPSLQLRSVKSTEYTAMRKQKQQQTNVNYKSFKNRGFLFKMHFLLGATHELGLFSLVHQLKRESI